MTYLYNTWLFELECSFAYTNFLHNFDPTEVLRVLLIMVCRRCKVSTIPLDLSKIRFQDNVNTKKQYGIMAGAP